MSIEAMKQALEALDLSHPRFGIGTAKHISATAALRQAIAEAEGQEKALQALHNENERLGLYKDAYAEQEPVAWTADDMAYRPSGLPQDFIRHEVESVYDWSDWVCPSPEQYFMKCCDCGLVHEMQFKVAKYKLGNECEFVEDTNLQAVFKARRTHPPQRTEQEPVIDKSAAIRIATALGWTPPKENT